MLEGWIWAGEVQRLIPLVVNKRVKLEVQRGRRRQEPWSRQEELVRARGVAMGMEMREWCTECFWCRIGRARGMRDLEPGVGRTPSFPIKVTG